MPPSSPAALSDQEVLELNIISALELQALPEEQKVQLLNNMATLIQKRSMVAMLELLSEDDKKALEELIAAEGEESAKIADFLRTHIDDIEGIFRRELVALKREVLEDMSKLESAPAKAE